MKQNTENNKEKLTNELVSIGKFSKWKGMSANTIKRDVDLSLIHI